MTENTSEDLLISSRDYQRLVEVHSNEGYKEGITSGRESRLQISFDTAYKQGFENAFKFGEYLAWKQLNPSEIGIIDIENEPLQRLQGGLCPICSDTKSMENKTIEEIAKVSHETCQPFHEKISSLIPKQSS